MTDFVDSTSDDRTINNMMRQKTFEEAARPLIEWLCANVHPHHVAIVTPTGAELLEGLCSTGEILDYIKD